MKLKHIAAAAAAVALASAGMSAQAAYSLDTGNQSLLLVAYDVAGGTTTSGIFDLGLTLDDFSGASTGAGFVGTTFANDTSSSIVWDFNANTISVNGAVSTAYGGNDWTAAWNTLLANSDAADLRFVMTAIDLTGFGSNSRAWITGNQNPTTAQLGLQDSTNFAAIKNSGVGQAKDVTLSTRSRGTHPTADNGAYTFTAADGATTLNNGFVMAPDGLRNNWFNAAKLGTDHKPGDDVALWLLGNGVEIKALNTISLNAATGQLVYGTPSVVPEPGTYALMFGGLAAVGALVRRRRAA